MAQSGAELKLLPQKSYWHERLNLTTIKAQTVRSMAHINACSHCLVLGINLMEKTQGPGVDLVRCFLSEQCSLGHSSDGVIKLMEWCLQYFLGLIQDLLSYYSLELAMFTLGNQDKSSRVGNYYSLQAYNIQFFSQDTSLISWGTSLDGHTLPSTQLFTHSNETKPVFYITLINTTSQQLPSPAAGYSFCWRPILWTPSCIEFILAWCDTQLPNGSMMCQFSSGSIVLTRDFKCNHICFVWEANLNPKRADHLSQVSGAGSTMILHNCLIETETDPAQGGSYACNCSSFCGWEKNLEQNHTDYSLKTSKRGDPWMGSSEYPGIRDGAKGEGEMSQQWCRLENHVPLRSMLPKPLSSSTPAAGASHCLRSLLTRTTVLSCINERPYFSYKSSLTYPHECLFMEIGLS
ncbi:hypothetical protein VNO77_21768 [Canavalia gladiata]|uniref:Uncharacterized protein n=1 Tax=Canavalia gladiata TaxID=3824 RepID=A0AAN9Q9W4_CANGL